MRAKQSRYLPTVLTQDEAIAVIQQLSGVYQLVAKLLYGSGLRLSEALQLRAKDIDFAQRQIVVRDGKGGNSRITLLPLSLVEPLRFHLQGVRQLHQQDLAQGYGSVYLPFALERKYPHADREWIWQYIFPADRRSKDPRSGVVRRHHLDESGLQKALKRAVNAAEIDKRVSCHTFRHSFAPTFCRIITISALSKNYWDIYSLVRTRELRGDGTLTDMICVTSLRMGA